MGSLHVGDGGLEPGDLQLPVPGLYADFESGRGSVRLPDSFAACSSAQQLEVLDDWLDALAACRRRALLRLYHEVSTEPGLPTPERLMRFRATCRAMRIEVPADFDPADAAR